MIVDYLSSLTLRLAKSSENTHHMAHYRMDDPKYCKSVKSSRL